VPPILSVVDYESLKEPYSNPLIVIPFENGITKNFVTVLSKRIEEKFAADSTQVEIITFEKKNNELSLNTNTDIVKRVNKRVSEDGKDIVLLFQPTKMIYQNGMLQTAKYIISGTDTKTNKEIWKAEFTSQSAYGPSLFAEKAAKSFYDKLKIDKIL
jgi:hypothetical protein